MKNRKFFTLLFLEVLFVLGVSAYFLVDSADIYKLFMGDTKFYEQSQNCDLHVDVCSADIPQKGKIYFEIEPKSIPLMQELTFKVYTQNDLNKDELTLNIFAINMNMGYHTLKLKKIGDKTYETKATLPTCPVGGMIWRAEVVIGADGGVFGFKTQ